MYTGILRGDCVDLLLGKVKIPVVDFLKWEKRLSIVAILREEREAWVGKTERILQKTAMVGCQH